MHSSSSLLLLAATISSCMEAMEDSISSLDMAAASSAAPSVSELATDRDVWDEDGDFLCEKKKIKNEAPRRLFLIPWQTQNSFCLNPLPHPLP